MENIIAKRSGNTSLRFKGKMIASGNTSWNNAASNYSGRVGRQEDVEVYKTDKGNYIVMITYETQWQGEHDLYEANVFPDAKSCIDYLREQSLPSWLFDDIIDDFGEEAIEEI